MASIGEVLGEAKVRRDGVVGWRNVQEGDSLYPKDSVVSLDDTTVRIDLKDGTSFNLTPNTLLDLVPEQDKLDIDLHRGFLGMNLVNFKNRLIVKVGKKEIEIKSQNAKIHVSLNETQETNLTVIDGIANIKFKGNEVSMKKGEKIKVDDKATKLDVSTFGIGPQRPGMDKIIFQEQGKEVNFEWDSTQNVEEYDVRAAKDPQFKNVVGQLKTKEKKAAISLAEEGRYYWQVVGLVGNKVASEAPIYSFTVRKDSGPNIIYPGSNAVLELGPKEENMDLTLRWEDQSSESYEVEVFKYGADKEKGELIQTKETYLSLTSLEPKEYKWRVRAIDRTRPDIQWSEFRNFIVADYRPREGSELSGPRRRREFFDDKAQEWKRK